MSCSQLPLGGTSRDHREHRDDRYPREDSERDKLGQLSVVKSALMSVLLTGELRVTPDPETR